MAEALLDDGNEVKYLWESCHLLPKNDGNKDAARVGQSIPCDVAELDLEPQYLDALVQIV